MPTVLLPPDYEICRMVRSGLGWGWVGCGGRSCFSGGELVPAVLVVIRRLLELLPSAACWQPSEGWRCYQAGRERAVDAMVIGEAGSLRGTVVR